MNILVIGEQENLAECKEKFGHQSHKYACVSEHREAEKFLMGNDLILDFILDEEPDQFEVYTSKPVTAFINTCKISLGELVAMADHKVACTLFGFTGLPTFLNRHILETSVWREEDKPKLKDLCEKLNTPYLVVDDRVGMLTPRVICMIINEAFYTVQEGTASRDDIDSAMKLGTSYPYGPFEWSNLIGVTHVFEVLEALYHDTRDERYKICPLLKKEYLKAM